LFRKYRELIFYGIFGVLTTIINLGVYALLYKKIGIANVPSNIIAWIAAVIFAFITNKIFVFESRSFKLSILIRELT